MILFCGREAFILSWSLDQQRSLSNDLINSHQQLEEKEEPCQLHTSRLLFDYIINTLNFHCFQTYLNTKKQGILSPKRLKKSSLDFILL